MDIRYLMTSSEMTQKIGNIVEYNDMYTLILTWQHSRSSALVSRF